jgi:hypothetical protein
VDARLAPCLDLELVYGGTRSLGYRQRPPGPHRERLRIHRWGQLELKVIECPPSMLRNIDGGPREVPELVIREHPPSTLRNIDGGPSRGARAEDAELKIRERSPSILRNVNGGPPGGVGAGDSGAPTINAKKHRWQAPGRCQS